MIESKDSAYNDVAKLSLRDPAGALFEIDNRMIRLVRPEAVSSLTAALNSATCESFLSRRELCDTKILEKKELPALFERFGEKALYDLSQVELVLEHERIAFPSFPHEWPAEMLYEAGRLTLDFAEALLPEGLGLKDATPFNVLFTGPRPVFIDILSIEHRFAADATWVPFAQFVRTFLLPLLVNKYFGLPLSMVFMTHRDGLEPSDVYPLCGPFQKFQQPFFSLITVPQWLSKNKSVASGKAPQRVYARKPEKARFILKLLFRHLRRMLYQLAPANVKQSEWSNYMGKELPYSDTQFTVKENFVDSVLAEFRPKNVLDVGCNNGHFSLRAARHGASVVALDYDAVCVGEAWRKAKAESLEVLPLVVNLTRPTPSLGWRNKENASFLDRARGRFDLVLMLAVLHHMTIGERIPLGEVLSLVSGLTTRFLLIEFVGPNDPMVRRLVASRGGYAAPTYDQFEGEIKKYFNVVRSYPVPESDRTLYLLKKHGA